MVNQMILIEEFISALNLYISARIDLSRVEGKSLSQFDIPDRRTLNARQREADEKLRIAIINLVGTDAINDRMIEAFTKEGNLLSAIMLMQPTKTGGEDQ